MDTKDSNLFTYERIIKSINECSKGVKWKKYVQSFLLNDLERALELIDDLEQNKYQQKNPSLFTIYEPKKRDVLSINFRDRCVQKILVEQVIFPLMSKSYIITNCACQPGKGTDYARDYLKRFLRKYYLKYKTNDGFIIHIDIKRYYPSLSHKRSLELFKKKLPKDIYKMVEEILSVYQGEIGYNPGSQLVQILGLSYLDSIDHFIKEKLKVKFYLRYMDDLILLVKDNPQYYIDEIEKELNKIGLELNRKKTKYNKLYKGDTFLGFDYRLNEKGKAYQCISSQSFKRMRLKFTKKAIKQTLEEFEETHICYINYLKKRAMNKSKIKELEKLYIILRRDYYDDRVNE